MITLCFYNNDGETCDALLQPTHATLGRFSQDIETFAVKEYQSINLATKGKCDTTFKLSRAEQTVSSS
jgi:hypothetical protein